RYNGTCERESLRCTELCATRVICGVLVARWWSACICYTRDIAAHAHCFRLACLEWNDLDLPSAGPSPLDQPDDIGGPCRLCLAIADYWTNDAGPVRIRC